MATSRFVDMRKPEDDATTAEAVAVLDRVRSHHRALLAMQAAELEDVVAWADLHLLETPVDVPDGLGSGTAGHRGSVVPRRAGAHGVEEFAVSDLAGTLGDLRAGCADVRRGGARAPRPAPPPVCRDPVRGAADVAGREIARQTRTLSPEVAAYVDAHLAPFAHKVNGTRITRAVEAALLHCDPEAAKQRAAEAAEKRHVTVEDHLGGISTLTAVLRTPDAVALEQRVFVVAEWLALLGDTDSAQRPPVQAPSPCSPTPKPPSSFEQRAWDHVRGNDRRATASPLARSGPTTGAGVPPARPPRRRRGLRDLPGRPRRGPRPPPPGPARRGRAVARRGRPRHHAQADPGRGHRRAHRRRPLRSPTQASPARSTRPSTSAPSPGAADAAATTSTTSSNTSTPTKADHPARPSSTNIARLCRFHHRVKTHTTWTSSATARRRPALDQPHRRQLPRRPIRHHPPLTRVDAADGSRPGAQRGPVDELGGATVERPALERLQVEVGALPAKIGVVAGWRRSPGTASPATRSTSPAASSARSSVRLPRERSGTSDSSWSRATISTASPLTTVASGQSSGLGQRRGDDVRGRLRSGHPRVAHVVALAAGGQHLLASGVPNQDHTWVSR